MPVYRGALMTGVLSGNGDSASSDTDRSIYRHPDATSPTRQDRTFYLSLLQCVTHSATTPPALDRTGTPEADRHDKRDPPADFFRDQISASKQIQRGLSQRWTELKTTETLRTHRIQCTIHLALATGSAAAHERLDTPHLHRKRWAQPCAPPAEQQPNQADPP